MNDFSKSLDQHIEGIYNPNAPFNRSDDPMKEDQVELLERIQMLGFNVVTCGECGNVFLVTLEYEAIICPHCDFEGEQCDNPDLFYPGWDEHYKQKEKKC